MCEISPKQRLCSRVVEKDVQVMISGVMRSASSAEWVVRRGMTVICRGGEAAGRVAAVVVERGSQQALCLILTRLPEEPGYQAVPAAWVNQVDEAYVRLRVPRSEVVALPDWHPEG